MASSIQESQDCEHGEPELTAGVAEESLSGSLVTRGLVIVAAGVVAFKFPMREASVSLADAIVWDCLYLSIESRTPDYITDQGYVAWSKAQDLK
jgi:hypothetical protein